MTMIWLKALGIKCRIMIPRSLVPKLLAASTNSRSRRESTIPLTWRASPPQPIKERMRVSPNQTMIGDHWGGIAAASAIQRGIVGKAVMNSIMRWTSKSMKPP